MNLISVLRYSRSIIIIHWFSSILLLISFCLGIYLKALRPEEKPFLPHLHGFIGNLVLLLTFFRVYLFFKQARPAPVKTQAKWNDALIYYTHRAFYVVIVLVGLTGLLAAVLKNRELSFLTKQQTATTYLMLVDAHAVSSYALLTMIVVHTVGVLKHIYLSGENILNRITYPASLSKKHAFTGFTILSIIFLFFYWFNFSNTRIDSSLYDLDEWKQEVNPGVPVQFSIIQTGTAQASEKLIFRAGDFSMNRTLSHIAVWVRHPKGNLLFDTGLSDNVDVHFEEMPFPARLLINYKKGKSVKKQLLENNIGTDTIQHIVMSHLHWDHAGGIKDFPNASVWIDEAELKFAHGKEAKTPPFIPRQYTGAEIKWRSIPFVQEPYLCFEESYDFYGDGSVVIVKLGGHTAGSTGMFLTLANGRRFFFTGDITWVVEGFEKLSPKHRLPSAMVDKEPQRIYETMFKVQQLMKADSLLTVVPSHDFQVQRTIKHFPLFEQ